MGYTWFVKDKSFVERSVAARVVLHLRLHTFASMDTAFIEFSIVQGELDVWILSHSY